MAGRWVGWLAVAVVVTQVTISHVERRLEAEREARAAMNRIVWTVIIGDTNAAAKWERENEGQK